jgi:benzoyl-CoA reductase/2-hydroxyglutaryl-CoA dehydratase subunit BcrC/BadD/HgdB
LAARPKKWCAIEENGGWVVGYENCTGAKATERNVAEDGDVYDALTDKYLAIGCSCISPNTERLRLLSQMVEEYQADGVVDVILQACHTYAVESLAIKRHVRQQHNIPTWRLRRTTPPPISGSSAPASPRLLRCCKESG